jgi:hypothetical protein
MTGTPSGAAFDVARDSDLGVGVGVKGLVVEPSRACDIRFIEDMREPSDQASAAETTRSGLGAAGTEGVVIAIGLPL